MRSERKKKCLVCQLIDARMCMLSQEVEELPSFESDCHFAAIHCIMKAWDVGVHSREDYRLMNEQNLFSRWFIFSLTVDYATIFDDPELFFILHFMSQKFSQHGWRMMRSSLKFRERERSRVCFVEITHQMVVMMMTVGVTMATNEIR